MGRMMFIGIVWLAMWISQLFINRVEGAAARGGLVSVAADGETFGHHARYGERVVAYALAVEAPRRGIETLTGTLRQTTAYKVPGGSGPVGRKGLHLQLSATGTGRLLDPKRPKAVLVLAGNAVVAG